MKWGKSLFPTRGYGLLIPLWFKPAFCVLEVGTGSQCYGIHSASKLQCNVQQGQKPLRRLYEVMRVSSVKHYSGKLNNIFDFAKI